MKTKLRMVLYMKKILNIITFSIFILLASSYSLCYATPSGLTPEQMDSELESLDIFNQKMGVVLNLSRRLPPMIDKQCNDEASEEALISELFNIYDLLIKVSVTDIPIPNTTPERKRIFISCISAFNDVCTSEQCLNRSIIDYRIDKTLQNKKYCHNSLLDVQEKINIFVIRLENLKRIL